MNSNHTEDASATPGNNNEQNKETQPLNEQSIFDDDCDEFMLVNKYVFPLQSPASAKKVDIYQLNNELDNEKNINLGDLLKSWNLQHLSDLLIDEGITVSHLKIIKPHNIKHLFTKLNTKMGDIVQFENQLEMWRDNLKLPYYDYSPKNFNNSDISYSRSVLDINSSALRELNTFCSSPNTSESSYSVSKESELCTVTLAEILMKNTKGQLIIDYHQKYNKLESVHRTQLINLIAQYFEENDLHLNLATSYRLEREIIQMFHTEKKEYYRIGKRGKIYAKFSNLKSHTKKLTPKELIPKASTSKKCRLDPEEDAEQCIKSLKYDNLSKEDFDCMWQACCQYRLSEIRNSTLTVKQIFEKWPQYKFASGNRLIDKDFSFLHPEKEDILTNWKEKFQKILNFLKQENRIKSCEIQNILKEIKIEDYDKDVAIIRLLWCIHGFLVPTQKISRKDNTGNKKITKFTIRDSQETFIYVGKSVQQIDDHIAFIKSRGENIQPLILAVGNPDLTNFEMFYIYVDGVKLQFTNILRAVDICFKMFYLLNLEYPLAGENFWNFMQQYFYKINVTKNKSSKVFFMLDELNKDISN